MTITLPAFTPLEESLFLTLCCRALDNREEEPVLGDVMAAEIVRTLDYEEILLSRDLVQVPSKLRPYYRLQAHSTTWSRKGTIILHFSF